MKIKRIEIEQVIKKCFNEKENLPHNLKYEINGLTRTFINKSKQICKTRKNQEFHKILFGLKNKTNMKIVKYEKGNGICLMYKDDYLNKLNAIVEDKTKFKLIEKDKKKIPDTP